MSPPAKPLEVPVSELALSYCPICKMEFGTYPIADTLRYEGKLYGFCSLACRDTFVQRRGR